MIGIFRRRSRRAGDSSSGKLPQLLADYPPYETPFPGDPRKLSLAQCEENLHYLLDQRAARLKIAADLLRRFDIDLDAGLVAPKPDALLASLDAWAHAEWPAAYTPAFSASPKLWLPRHKAGEHIVLAMLMDIAIVLGQVVINKRADYGWRLDDAIENRDMGTYRRVVATKARDDPRWTATALDFETECIYYFDSIGRNVPGDPPIGTTALAAVTGRYDPTDTIVAGPTGAASSGPTVYDKAKNHAHVLVDDGFDPEYAEQQAAVPGALFLGWLASRGLLSRGHTKWLRREIEAFEAQRQTAVDLYGRLDRCLIDYMLSAEGNAFTQDYFNAADGYYRDLAKTLAEDLPSEFHIPYTFENQARIDAILDQRYAEWSSGRPSS
ncbi:Uncharacterised protein [Mycobacteroides abscessus subsp. massiliense]|uniref:DUF7832 domain-containing protein n=1 Tax=Mycobacteroides abscessus TaxID=36809 RepID=UPI0009A8293D|nr:hypothetical protein [Mycobacteroides abscessus]SLH88438.1 Uncharacterised protein [Mycobacteroides abscessus subsp. massiliense]SLI25581.1 Uncharacterised protein [Mycobacteroides abscessus subsp. massiliense]